MVDKEDTNGLEEGDEKALIQARAQRRLAARAREEAERKAREEAELKAREEAERRAQEEAELRVREEAHAEAERKIRQEAERIAREEAESREREEAERLAKEQAEQQVREEAECKEREKAERIAREEVERQEKEDAKRRAREDAERHAREEAERKIREEAEADERERAEIEARVRAAAEARANEEAKIKKKPVKYQYRRSIPWGGIALISFAILIVLPLILLHVLSLNMLIPATEKLASEWLREPVAITSVRASLWPKPHLTLGDVSIGAARDVKIPAIQVMPELSTLFDENKTIKSIEVDALVLDQESLGRVPGWLGGSTPKLRLEKIVLNNAKVGLKGIDLPPFAGEVILSDEGQFMRAHFMNLDRKLELDVVPKKKSEFELNLSANGWQPVLGPKLLFDELTAKAVVSREGMKISEIAGRFYGGVVKGNAQVSWNGAVRAEGAFGLERIDLENATRLFTSDIALNGTLDAKVTCTLEAAELKNLFASPRIKAEFSSRDGSLGTLDLAHALQSRAREYVGNGKTGYETLTGSMALAGNRYQFRQLKLNAGLLKAYGEADVSAGKDLSGRVNVEMQLKSAPMRSPFAISGSLQRIVLKRTD